MSRKSSSRSQAPVARRSAQDCWQQGRVLSKAGRWHDALQFFEQALAQAPEDDVYLINAAHACFHLQRMEDVVRYASLVIDRNPKDSLAFVLKAKALNRLQRHAENLTFLRNWSQELQATHDYWFHLGLAHHGMQQHREAVNAFLQAMQLKLDDELTHYYLGSAFYEAGLKEEAAECFRTSLALGLGRHALHVHGLLAFAERENCRWQLVREEWQSIQALLDDFNMTDAVMTSPFAHLSLTDDPYHHLKISTLMANTWAKLSAVVSRSSVSSKGTRIRLGYLSGDFHQHATCVLMAEVFEHHDRERFEVFAYSHGIDDGSPMRQRVMAAFEHFVDLRGLSDEQAAQRIADDEIDVLIDLKGYTAHHRLGIMARRPAPVQATFLGFPGTTGGKFMDYIIGDPVVTPLVHADHFAEKIAQMPVCYQPNDRQRPKPVSVTRAEFGLPDEAVVLCGFNQAYKISPDVLDVWCEILRELPEAVLWLLDWHGQARPNLEREIEARGVGLERVYWAPKASLSVHISRMRLADVFLDTWPYNAHTTCSDALWAGLPVVTYEGQTFACRVASSLLSACQLSEWVANSLPSYVTMVLRIARDSGLRAEIRRHLDAQRDTSALFDSLRFTRDFEALASRMFDRNRQGLPVAALPAEESVQISPRCVPDTPVAQMKVAVVTPYHAESRAWLERCIHSVQSQSYAATHFLVADGVAQDWIDDVPGVRHIKLGAAHRDYGNTPRAIGGVLAISEGYDAICFLDADNWYEPDHVASCIAVAERTNADYVFARRRLVREDGSVMQVEYQEDVDGSHVDTNCFCLLAGAFHTLPRWALAPKPMASLFDRFYLKSLIGDGLRGAPTQCYTVMYLCTWADVYRGLGEMPPEFAKENLSSEPFVQWRKELTQSDVEHVRKLVGPSL